MEQTELRACRACLATDCELYELSENGLLEKFQQVTSLRLCTIDSMPKYICSFCRALLLKTYRFRKNCLEIDKIIARNAGYLDGICYVKEASMHELSLTEMLVLAFGGENEFVKNIDEQDSREIVVMTHDIVLKEDPSEVDMLQNVDGNVVDEPVSDENHISSTSSHLDELAIPTDIKDELLENSPESELADSCIESKDPLEVTTAAIKTECNIKDNIFEISPKNDLNENIIESNYSHVGFNEETIHNTESEHSEKVAEDINAINVKITINSEGKVNIFKRNPMRRLKSTDFTAAINESELLKRNYDKKAPAHLAQHHKEVRPYRCELCGRAYKRQSHLNEQHHRSHMERSPVACDICGQMFNSRYLKTHLARVHRELTSFPCTECTMIFNSMECLKSHQNEVHMDGRSQHRSIVCDICGKIFTSKASVKYHKLVHSEKGPYSCKHCKKTFKTRSARQCHIKIIHSEEKLYPCKQCDKTFKTRYAIRLHKAVHREEWPYPCKHCGKRFKINSALHYHINTVHNEARPYSCMRCGVDFKAKTSLKSHQRRRHMAADSNDQSYTCKQCRKTFKNKFMLKDHQRTHKEQSCSCEICGKVFKTQYILKCHKRLHTGKYFFTCDICGKTFKTRSGIQLHIKTVHSEARPYPCKQCGKTFKTRSAIKLHIKTVHSKATPYPCTQCDKAFKFPYKLKIHQQVHTTDKTIFTCVICGKAHRHKVRLLMHIKNSHINEPWPKLILNRIREC